jgi:acyl-CoA-dependent ceramide synthase
VLFQTSKTLNYIDHWAQGPYFGMFMCIWIYLRHYLNLKIILSLFFEYRTIGPFELNWETEQYKSPLSQVISFVLLSLLQALNIFWLFFILRIAYRFIVDRQAHDDRSEDEASEDEQAEAEVEAEKERRREKERKMLLLNGHANGTAAAAATATSTAMAPPEVLLNGLPVEVNGHANGKNKENDRITRSKGKAQ